MRILLAEKGGSLLRLSRLLEYHDMAVEKINNAAEAVFMAKNIDYDVIILSDTLDETPDFPTLSTIRSNQEKGRKPRIPVLIDSSHQDRSRIITALDKGADDYVIRPFRPEEIVSRVFALYRRSLLKASNKAYFGPFEFDSKNGSLKAKDVPLHLTPTETRVLRRLAADMGTVVKPRSIVESTYARTDVPLSNSVEVVIRRIRAAIEPYAEGFQYIHTENRFGYVLRDNPDYKTSENFRVYAEGIQPARIDTQEVPKQEFTQLNHLRVALK